MNEEILTYSFFYVQVYLIKNANVVNSGIISAKDVLIKHDHIEKVENNISKPAEIEINSEGKYLIHGMGMGSKLISKKIFVAKD